MNPCGRLEGDMSSRKCKYGEEVIKEACAMYESGLPLAAICKRFGMGDGTAHKMVSARCKMRSPHEKKWKPCREDAFEIITEESAYWAGFLMADGSVTGAQCKRMRQVSLMLQEGDKGHIRKFLDWLNSDVSISIVKSRGFKRKGSEDKEHLLASASVSSNRLVESLVALGVVPRKTYCAKASDAVAMNKHFWRGCIDGDGTVIVWQQSKEKGGIAARPVVRLAGHRDLVEQFAEFVSTVIPGYKPSIAKTSSHIVTSSVVGANAIALARHLYADCTIALDRKLDRALEMLCLDYGADQRALRKNVYAPDGMAWCGRCKQYKPCEAFGKCKARRNGLACLCKPCAAHKRTLVSDECRERKNKKRMERYYKERSNK